MVKSYTQKKYAKKNKTPVPHEVKELTNAATDYIKHWTNREIGKLHRDEKTPICIPVKNGYRVGLYHLTVYPNRTCAVYDHNREFVHCFESKVSAVLYTIYTIKNRLYIADELLLWDREINKNYADMLNLRRIIEAARKREDYNVVDSRLARFEVAETKLNFAREKIAQIHRIAKLNKVWE